MSDDHECASTDKDFQRPSPWSTTIEGLETEAKLWRELADVWVEVAPKVAPLLQTARRPANIHCCECNDLYKPELLCNLSQP